MVTRFVIDSMKLKLCGSPLTMARELRLAKSAKESKEAWRDSSGQRFVFQFPTMPDSKAKHAVFGGRGVPDTKVSTAARKFRGSWRRLWETRTGRCLPVFRCGSLGSRRGKEGLKGSGLRGSRLLQE